MAKKETKKVEPSSTEATQDAKATQKQQQQPTTMKLPLETILDVVSDSIANIQDELHVIHRKLVNTILMQPQEFRLMLELDVPWDQLAVSKKVIATYESKGAGMRPGLVFRTSNVYALANGVMEEAMSILVFHQPLCRLGNRIPMTSPDRAARDLFMLWGLLLVFIEILNKRDVKQGE